MSNRTIEVRHVLNEEDQIVDIRPQGEIFAEWLSSPLNFLKVVPAIVAACALFPALLPIGGPAFLILTIMFVSTKYKLPLRYPVGSKDEKGKPGKGILMVGEVASKSEYENFKEIWLTDDDMRKHMLILGSTGSGKSEALKAIFFNALNWSSGFFIADGKADNKLPTDVYTMCRSNGRDQDMLILNFLLAGKTPEQVRLSRRRRTNKLNPFTTADADTIIQMGANLLPKVDGDAKNWQEKALNLWRSVVQAVCYKRDTTGFEISVSTFLDYMALQKVEELYIEGFREAQTRGGEWSYGFAGVKNYLDSGCPAYQVEKLLKKHKLLDVEDAAPARKAPFGAAPKSSGKEFEQDNAAYEQHAYRTNQLMPVLNLLDKTYGFIFRDKYPEIDMTDVTLRNRVLVMLIPSLEKSASEAENLGKLAIACLRVMMGKNLGSEVEGFHEDLLGSKATNSPYPYVVALDELAYYFSDGIAVMFAQARSLGTSMIAAAQDLEKLTEGSRASEAGAMLANTTIKFFMRIDDTGKTAEMIHKVVGKVNVAMKRTFERGFMHTYGRQSNVEVQQVDLLPTRKMQAFGQGEGVVNAMGKTTFMRWFYMGKDIEKHRVDHYWINRFLQVAPASDEQVIANSTPMSKVADPYEQGRALLRKLRGREAANLYVPEDPVISAVAQMANSLSPHEDAAERGIALYMAAREAILKAQAVSMDGLPVEGVASNESSERDLAQAGQQRGFPAVMDLDQRLTPEAVIAASQEPSASDMDSLGFMNFDVGSTFERKPSKDIISLDKAADTLGKRQESLVPGPSQPIGSDMYGKEIPVTMAALGGGVTGLMSLFSNQVKFKPQRNMRVARAGAESVLLDEKALGRLGIKQANELMSEMTAQITGLADGSDESVQDLVAERAAEAAAEREQSEEMVFARVMAKQAAGMEDDWVSMSLINVVEVLQADSDAEAAEAMDASGGPASPEQPDQAATGGEAGGAVASETGSEAGGGMDAMAVMADMAGMVSDVASGAAPIEGSGGKGASRTSVQASSRNTVVGFSDATIEGLSKVERLMNHPEPKNAARTFERAVSSRVTPDTEAKGPAAGDSEIDKLFSSLEDRWNF